MFWPPPSIRGRSRSELAVSSEIRASIAAGLTPRPRRSVSSRATLVTPPGGCVRRARGRGPDRWRTGRGGPGCRPTSPGRGRVRCGLRCTGPRCPTVAGAAGRRGHRTARRCGCCRAARRRRAGHRSAVRSPAVAGSWRRPGPRRFRVRRAAADLGLQQAQREGHGDRVDPGAGRPPGGGVAPAPMSSPVRPTGPGAGAGAAWRALSARLVWSATRAPEPLSARVSGMCTVTGWGASSSSGVRFRGVPRCVPAAGAAARGAGEMCRVGGDTRWRPVHRGAGRHVEPVTRSSAWRHVEAATRARRYVEAAAHGCAGWCVEATAQCSASGGEAGRLRCGTAVRHRGRGGVQGLDGGAVQGGRGAGEVGGRGPRSGRACVG